MLKCFFTDQSKSKAVILIFVIIQFFISHSEYEPIGCENPQSSETLCNETLCNTTWVMFLGIEASLLTSPVYVTHKASDFISGGF